MKRSNLDNPTERDAIEAVLGGLTRFREPEREKWVTMVATTALSVMYGTYGRKFMEGYLHAARMSLDNPDEAAPIKVEERLAQ